MAAAPEEYKVHLAQLYFIGPADVWLRRSGLHRQQMSWTQFAEEVTHRFSGHSTYELAEQFNNIRQNNLSIKQYTEVFEELMADIREENPDLQEDWFIRCYVNGMKDSIKSQLRPLRPRTLTSAYWQAREMERCQPVKKTFAPQFRKFSPNTSYKPTQNFTPIVNTVPETTIPKTRVKGQCWRCGDPNWQPGHKCRPIPVLNFLAQALDQEQMEQMCNTDNKEEQELATEQAEQAANTTHQTQLMNISLQALGAQHSTTTPTVLISIKGKKAIALIDSGSSNSFMDLSFAVKCGCTLVQDEAREVKVAGGGILISDSIAPDCMRTKILDRYCSADRFGTSFAIFRLTMNKW